MSLYFTSNNRNLTKPLFVFDQISQPQVNHKKSIGIFCFQPIKFQLMENGSWNGEKILIYCNHVIKSSSILGRLILSIVNMNFSFIEIEHMAPYNSRYVINPIQFYDAQDKVRTGKVTNIQKTIVKVKPLTAFAQACIKSDLNKLENLVKKYPAINFNKNYKELNHKAPLEYFRTQRNMNGFNKIILLLDTKKRDTLSRPEIFKKKEPVVFRNHDAIILNFDKNRLKKIQPVVKKELPSFGTLNLLKSSLILFKKQHANTTINSSDSDNDVQESEWNNTEISINSPGTISYNLRLSSIVSKEIQMPVAKHQPNIRDENSIVSSKFSAVSQNNFAQIKSMMALRRKVIIGSYD